MLIFLSIVFVIIIAVASTKKKQPKLPVRRADTSRIRITRTPQPNQVTQSKRADLKIKIAEQQNIFKIQQAENLKTKAQELKRKQQSQVRLSFQNNSYNVTTPERERKYEKRDESIIEVSRVATKISLLPIESLPFIEGPTSSLSEYDPDQYSLGKKYKEKLNLSVQEVRWLNKFCNYSNVFNSIEGCELEVIKLYLLTVKLLNKRLKKENSTLHEEITLLKIKTAEFEKSQPYSWQGYENVNTGGTAESEAYYFIYKKAESVIRDEWKHKRKITAIFNSRSVEVKEVFDQRLGQMIEEIITQLIPTISQPDETTEVSLNEATTTRWKVQFQELTAGYPGNDHSGIAAALHRLGKLNTKNPTVEHIYYEASKFMTSFDKIEALKFYLYYVWKDLNSTTVDNKQLNKTIQKKLFNNEEQLNTFQTIIEDLVTTRNFTAALKTVESVYQAKRKSITLDTAAIKRVQEQHSGTVNKLNEYLTDDEEVYQLSNANVETFAPTSTLSVVLQVPVLATSVNLNNTQLDCLRLFSTSDHMVPLAEIESFAKEKSLFRNQLIDGINDSCYDLLGDVLIEETEDGYEINPDYYKKILA